MTKPRKNKLTWRFNKDGSISLLARGRVMFKHWHWEAIQSFEKGWYGA